jgi:hypothetical protein
MQPKSSFCVPCLLDDRFDVVPQLIYAIFCRLKIFTNNPGHTCMSNQVSLAAATLGNPIGEYRPRWLALSIAIILMACFIVWATIWIGFKQPFDLVTVLFGATLAIGCFAQEIQALRNDPSQP